MDTASKAVTKILNNDVVISVALAGCFAALGFRSWKQQRNLQDLAAEKDSLIKSNKAMKKTIWDWKQQLYAEAEAASSNALVPLSKLKAIYGEADPTLATGMSAGDADINGKSPAVGILV